MSSGAARFFSDFPVVDFEAANAGDGVELMVFEPAAAGQPPVDQRGVKPLDASRLATAGNLANADGPDDRFELVS